MPSLLLPPPPAAGTSAAGADPLSGLSGAEAWLSHGPSEETHAHLQQLVVYYGCGGVLLGEALREKTRSRDVRGFYLERTVTINTEKGQN